MKQIVSKISAPPIEMIELNKVGDVNNKVIIAINNMTKRVWYLTHKKDEGYIFKELNNACNGMYGFFKTAAGAINECIIPSSYNDYNVYEFDSWIEAIYWLKENKFIS